MAETKYEYDVFLSYASEDKDYAQALYEELTERGVNVWYREHEIKLGDIIPQKLQEGLSKSRFGVVILSPTYFEHWNEQTLSTLFAQEERGGKRILPVLLGVDKKTIDEKSPFLAARESVSADDDFSNVVQEICEAVEAPPQQPKSDNLDSGYGVGNSRARKTIYALFAFLMFGIITSIIWDAANGHSLTVYYQRLASLANALDLMLPGNGLVTFRALSVILGVPWGLIYFMYMQPKSHDRGRKGLARWIEKSKGDVESAYKSAVKWVLDFITWVADDRDTGKYWSAKLFDRMLLIAFLYPILSATLSWAWSGHAGPAGDALGLKKDLELWPRILVAVLLLAQGPVFILVFSYSRNVAVGGAFAVTFAGAVGGAVAVAGAGAVAVAVAVAFAGAIAVAVAVAVLFGVAFAGALAVAFAFALVVAFALAGAFTFAFAFAGAVFFLFFFAFVFADAVAVKQGVYAYFGVWSMLLVSVPAVVGLGSFESNSIALLVYLGAVPIVNSLFDFLSVGVTRKLLEKSAKASSWGRIGWSLADFGFASVFMLLLTFSLAFYLEAINILGLVSVTNQQLIELQPIHDSIRSTPGNTSNYWVYFTLLSTFIPTAIHACAAGVAVILAVATWLINHEKDSKNLLDPRMSVAEKSELSFRLTACILSGIITGLAVMIGLMALTLTVLNNAIGLVAISEAGQSAARWWLGWPAVAG